MTNFRQIPKKIFLFNNVVDFLDYELKRKKESNSHFSLRCWSRRLGFKNPSLLSSILKGKRRLSMNLAQKISLNLNLNIEEQRYFELLVLLQNSKTEYEKNIYQAFVKSLTETESTRPSNTLTQIDAFAFISSWINIAILELVSRLDVQINPTTIVKILGHNISTIDVENSLNLLQRLNLICLKNEKFVRIDKNSLLVEVKAPAIAIRLHHKKMIEIGLQSLENQPFSERIFRTSTLSFNFKNLRLVEQKIQDVHKEILALASIEKNAEIYQLNTQFFRLNENKIGLLK